MKKVLIISYYFPPDPEIGGLRIMGLGKYLPEFGWEPVILTKNNLTRDETPFNIFQTHLEDYNVLNSIKERIGLSSKVAVKTQIGLSNKKNKKSSIDKIFSLLMEIIAYPDVQKNWYEPAINVSNGFLQTEKIDAVISSSFPVTSHIIAASLKEQYQIPWVADLRDLWTQNHYYSYTPIRKSIERKLEITTLINADALTTVSETMAQTLNEIHKSNYIYCIPNGFDPYEFYENQKLTEKFTITYTGSFYHGKRDPCTLFAAIRDLISAGTINANDILIRLYGSKEDWMKAEIQKYELKDLVVEYGYVSRAISLEKQWESHILLLLLWNHPEENGVYTGKIFEYLAANRPILALGGPKSVVKDLLEETRAGEYATSVTEIKKIITQYYEEYKRYGSVKYKGEKEKIYKYSQKEMARKFSEILNKITFKEF